MEHTFFDVPVQGGDLRVARFGDGPRLVLGIHGITANSLAMAPVAKHLGPEYTLVAPDLRGLGDSNRLGGPFGLPAHAADCAAVLEHLGASDTVVVGHSMGAYITVVLAARRPELVARAVLVDGGLTPPMPEGVDIDVDEILDALLGPALARLRQVFESQEAYLDFWKAHPAVSEDWSPDVEEYLLYDLEPAEGGGFKSKVSEEAARADGASNLVDAHVVGDALRSLRCPVTLLRAVRGLLNQPEPLLPDFVVDMWRPEMPTLVDEVVDDTNHYTICFGDRSAKIVAERIAVSASR